MCRAGRSWTLTALLGAVWLAGCGQGSGAGPGAAVPSPDPQRVPPSGPRVDEVAGAWPPSCGTATTGQRLAWSAVDAGLGHRYLTLAVRNCGSSAITLPARPATVARDAKGAQVPLRLEWQEPTRPLALRGGEVAYLSLHWLGNGHCERGAASLVTTMLGQSVTATECLQLGDFETEQASSDTSGTVRLGWTRTPQQ